MSFLWHHSRMPTYYRRCYTLYESWMGRAWKSWPTQCVTDWKTCDPTPRFSDRISVWYYIPLWQISTTHKSICDCVLVWLTAVTVMTVSMGTVVIVSMSMVTAVYCTPVHRHNMSGTPLVYSTSLIQLRKESWQTYSCPSGISMCYLGSFTQTDWFALSAVQVCYS